MRGAVIALWAMGFYSWAEEPKAGPKYETIFVEDVKQVAQARFKQLRPGQTDQDLTAGKVTMHPGTGWVRPGFAGFTAEYAMKLEFPAIDAVGGLTSTDFFFVLHNRQVGGVRLIRERKESATQASLQFVRMAENAGADTTTVIRTIPVNGDCPNGEWTIVYRHGLIVVRAEGKELGRGFLNVSNAVVVGVTWDQHKGKLTCAGMSLRGVTPPVQSAKQQAELREASELNERGRKAFREGKIAESLEATSAAAMRYVKNLGEDHHDSANAHENLGVIFLQSGRMAEAQEMFDRCLKARRKVLGDDHPGTSFALMNKATTYGHQGKVDDAARCLQESLKIALTFEDSDSPRVKAIRNALIIRPE
jgi:hypothetical protein